MRAPASSVTELVRRSAEFISEKAEHVKLDEAGALLFQSTLWLLYIKMSRISYLKMLVQPCKRQRTAFP